MTAMATAYGLDDDYSTTLGRLAADILAVLET